MKLQANKADKLILMLTVDLNKENYTNFYARCIFTTAEITNGKQ